MLQIDFNLPGATFLNDGVYLEALSLGKIIDIVDDGAIFFYSAHAIRLSGNPLSAGTSNWRFNGQVRVDVGGRKVKFYFWCDYRLPAMLGIGVDNPLEHVSGRHGVGFAVLIKDIVNDLQGDIGRPRHGSGCSEVRHQYQIGFGPLIRHVVQVNIFAGYGLIENRSGHVHGISASKLTCRHGLAT